MVCETLDPKNIIAKIHKRADLYSFCIRAIDETKKRSINLQLLAYIAFKITRYTMSYCNKPQFIIPDPTINLQRVVNNGYKLQNNLPSQGNVIGFDNGNVVWGNFGGGGTQNLSQVLTQGNTATNSIILTDGNTQSSTLTVQNGVGGYSETNANGFICRNNDNSNSSELSDTSLSFTKSGTYTIQLNGNASQTILASTNLLQNAINTPSTSEMTLTNNGDVYTKFSLDAGNSRLDAVKMSLRGDNYGPCLSSIDLYTGNGADEKKTGITLTSNTENTTNQSEVKTVILTDDGAYLESSTITQYNTGASSRDNPTGAYCYSLYQNRQNDAYGGIIYNESQVTNAGFSTYIQDINDPLNPQAIYNTFKIETNLSNGKTFVGANDNNGDYFQFTGNNILELNDGGGGLNTMLSAGSLALLNGADSMSLSATTLNAQGGFGIAVPTDSQLALQSYNLTCHTLALPICLSNQFGGTITSYVGTNSWQRVYYKLWENIPKEFFSGTGYASTQWKMEFSINFYNFTNTNDKGFAFFINFADEQNNAYNGFTFNEGTPYAKDLQTNGYSQTSNNLYAFSYTDLFDFSGLTGTGDTNIPPLTIQLLMNGDKDHYADFVWNLTLTKTNIIV